MDSDKLSAYILFKALSSLPAPGTVDSETWHFTYAYKDYKVELVFEKNNDIGWYKGWDLISYDEVYD